MKKTLIKKHKEVVEKLKDFLEKWEFYLGGGTAVYYYLKHRNSIDLDFFTDKNLDFRNFKDYFLPNEISLISRDTIHVKVLNVNLSFFYFPYPLIKKWQKIGILKIASLEDILCMKINAIISRGSKKDFIDAYFIMRELGISSDEAILLYKKKFGEYNELIIRKAMIYFVDAEKEPEFPLIKKVKWEKVKKFFIAEFARL